MKVMNKKSASLIVAWIVLVLVGLSLISYHQQQYFEEHLEKIMGEMEEEMEYESINLGEEWENLKKSDPSKICYYFTLETTSRSYFYHLHVYEYFQKNDKGSVLTGTFSTQADEGALLESVLIIRVASSREYRGWCTDGEYCKILLDYSREYKGSNQTFDWEEFKDSDEFGEFVDEFFYYVENKKETTLQDTYHQIKDLENTATLRNPYRKALLQAYVHLAETAYSNYQMHKNQNEFTKAVMDAEVVYSVHGFSLYLDTKETVITTLIPFRRGDIYAHSAILDLAIVLTLSTFFTVVTWFMIKKKSSMSSE